MSEELNPPSGDHGTGAGNLDEFYVRRINWLVGLGRSDLIDEIADDCERRRSVPHPATGRCPATDAALTASPSAHGSTPDPPNLRDDEPGSRTGAPHDLTHNVNVAPRPPHPVHPRRSSQHEPRLAAGPPKPVQAGTRIAVDGLRRRSLRPAPWPRPGR